MPGGRQLDTGHRQGDAPRSESPFLGSIVTGPRLLGQTFLQRGRELERLFRLEVLAVLDREPTLWERNRLSRPRRPRRTGEAESGPRLSQSMAGSRGGWVWLGRLAAQAVVLGTRLPATAWAAALLLGFPALLVGFMSLESGRLTTATVSFAIAALAVTALAVQLTAQISHARKAAVAREAAEKAVEAEQMRADDQLGAQISNTAGNPKTILALCPHRVPEAIRLQRTEQAAWVVRGCGYLRTEKEVTYRGRSAGGSVRVAPGVTLRTGRSRGQREENEYLKQVDHGTVVLTDRHLYFLGDDKERFRVRLDKLVTAEAMADGFRFQRDGSRARPEGFLSRDARLLAIVLHVLSVQQLEAEAPPTATPKVHREDWLDALAAGEADLPEGD